MNSRIRTSLLSAALVGGSIIGVSQIGGVVNAQTDDESSTTEQVDETTLDDETTDDVDDETTDDVDDETADDENDDRHRGRRRGSSGSFEAVAEVIGIDADDLRTQVRDGATLGEIAEANGVDTEAVVDVIVDSKQERIAQSVEVGRTTQEEADERLAELDEQVTTIVEDGRPERTERADGEGRRQHRGDRDADDIVATDDADTDDADTDDVDTDDVDAADDAEVDATADDG